MNQVDRLYNLLPVFYRQRDIEQGSPLQVLLRVVAEQVNLLENDIGNLYDNWFIETCDDWVVPYIGDLIGYRPVHPGQEEDDLPGPVNKFLTPRREVANTIRYRRRKGTLSLLQELSLAAAGWPALAVEFDHYIGISQNLLHLHEGRGQVVNLRDVVDLDLIGTPFDSVGHTVDVRSPNSQDSPGKYNIASVGLFVWRLRVYRATHTNVYKVKEAGEHCYTFSTLGNDIPLYTRVLPQRPNSRTPGRLNLPIPIRRRAFEEHKRGESRASEKYYGEDKSVAIWASGWGDVDPDLPIPREKVIPADLSEWRYRPKTGFVAVDPELGRIAFPLGQVPDGDVWSSYSYAFSADIGGGEYARPIIVASETSTVYSVGAGQDFPKIQDAYEQWRQEQPVNAVIEIADSGLYKEELRFEFNEKQTLEVRAATGARPILSVSNAISVVGAAGSAFTLDGILLTGAGIEVRGDLDEFALRHCTLVPGWALHPDCQPRHANEPSLVLFKTPTRVQIGHSILGPIHVSVSPDGVDPLPVQISDSILDATNPENTALGTPEHQPAWAALTIQRSTVFGKVRIHQLTLAENSILAGHVHVARQQYGCVRFSYVPQRSHTPRRHHCQPDLVEQALREKVRHEQLSPEDLKALLRGELFRVEPAFVITRYGSPNYFRLSDSCAIEIKTGADDRSELGAFHDLYQPQRESNLRARLEEYSPAGMDVGIIFAN